MKAKSKNKITLKIILSYLVLAILALVSGFFIYSEIRVYISRDIAVENDTKLLKTGSVLTQLYEAESLSKLALQNKTKESFNLYSQKLEAVSIELDSLKLLTDNLNQKVKLDSVQLLLEEKLENSAIILELKSRNKPDNSIDNALKDIQKMEESMGKLTIENFNKNPEKLAPRERKVLEDWVAFLNKNIPENSIDQLTPQKADSILKASKELLNKTKQANLAKQRSLERKEIELNRADIMLSQQLREIISAFEKEVVANTYNDTLQKKDALETSIRLAGLAALLGFLIVGLFTLLITRDFLRLQSYRQKLEEEKKYSESLLKSREQLISTVSHDLKTPLNTINGFTELMENTALSKKQLGYLKNVRSASGYVDNLVNDLLDFSKLEAGKITIEYIPFVLSELLIETAENIKEIYHAKQLELRINIDPRLQQIVLGDPFRIRQILSNLIGNAFKFTQEGFVKIQATVKENTAKTYTVNIKVIDSGIGIPKEKQQAIFKEFTQAEIQTEKKYGGYGLGLTISKKLTRLLAGSLTLKSKVGKGSTFSLELPLAITKNTAKTIKPKTTRPVNGLSILILDDDSAMLRLLTELCDNEGIQVETYSNFGSISGSTNGTYDVILTDIQMPDINGFEVLESLHSDPPKHYKGQPIIAMTGRRDLEVKVYSTAGFADVLQKPFTKTTFLKTLGRLFPKASTNPVAEAKYLNNITATSPLFTMEVIISFLGNNAEAIQEVLETFIEDTRSNLTLLEAHIKSGDDEKIMGLAHRMLPMFKQLKAIEVIPILEGLEHGTHDSSESEILMDTYTVLKTKITALLKALETYLATSLSYID